MHVFSNSIENLHKELSPNKSPGPEGIPARVFRDLAPEIEHNLQVVFSKSESEHTLPRVWRVENFIPIFKKAIRGSHLTADQYHSNSKVLVKLISYGIDNNIID
jgi:hypothetical protein